MADDEIEISVGKDSLSVKSGGDAAARITNTISDLLSPFSEATGVIGDVIHYYRQDMALRAIGRAREIAKKTGANLQPVPPKFLVKWVEDASLEESENDELVDLWAGLLVSASTDFSPIHFQARRILSEITLDHIRFLEYICDIEIQNDHEFSLDADYSKYGELVNRDYEDPFQVESMEFEFLKPIFSSINNSRLTVHFAKLRKSGGLTMKHEIIWTTEEQQVKEFSSNFVTKYLIEVGIIENLERSINLKMADEKQRYFLELGIYHLTDFGVTLLNTCLPKREGTKDQTKGTTP